jgi:hypothetical protein
VLECGNAGVLEWGDLVRGFWWGGMVLGSRGSVQKRVPRFASGLSGLRGAVEALPYDCIKGFQSGPLVAFGLGCAFLEAPLRLVSVSSFGICGFGRRR